MTAGLKLFVDMLVEEFTGGVLLWLLCLLLCCCVVVVVVVDDDILSSISRHSVRAYPASGAALHSCLWKVSVVIVIFFMSVSNTFLFLRGGVNKLLIITECSLKVDSAGSLS